MAFTESWIDISGVPLRLLRNGNGPILLFLHGAAGLQGWLPFFEEMSASYSFIAAEHPGYGFSHAQTWAGSMDKLADFYAGAIEQLAPDGVHLVGSSIGGWLSSEIAQRAPSRVKSLVLLAPAGLQSPGREIPDILRWTYPELMRNVFHNQSLAEQLISLPTSEATQEFRDRNHLATERLCKDGFFSINLAERLNGIDIPTTVIWGDNDRIIPTECAQLWQAAIKQASLQIVPSCGHLPHVEKLEKTTLLVRRHLGVV